MKARLEFDIAAPTREAARERLRHFAELIFEEPDVDMVEAKLLSFLCAVEDIDESGGYDPTSPKHPNYHSIRADIYDTFKEGK